MSSCVLCELHCTKLVDDLTHNKQIRMYCGSGTRDRSASGQLADATAYVTGGRCDQMAALFCAKRRNSRHLETVTLNRKSDSVNRCVFAWRTFLPYFIPIRLKTTKPYAFWRASAQQQEEQEEEQQQEQ